MKITDIYLRYKIFNSLEIHQLKVAAVGKIICDHFTDLNLINPDLLIKTLLLHDMGNLIKVDLTRLNFFTPEERSSLDKIKATQQEFIQKYGNNADAATLKIIAEVTDDKTIIDLCANSRGDQMQAIIDSDRWNEKIAYYADMRVGPSGVISVNQRFDDLQARYPQERAMERYRQECLKIEQQLQPLTNIDITSINEDLIMSEIATLKQVEIV